MSIKTAVAAYTSTIEAQQETIERLKNQASDLLTANIALVKEADKYKSLYNRLMSEIESESGSMR